MKLLYIANARLPSEKAHVYQIMKMCEAFAGHGLEVEFVHARRRNTPQMRAVGDVWDYYGVQRSFRLTGLPCLDLMWLVGPLGAWASYLAFLLQAATFALALLVYLIFRRADVYYSRDIVSLLFVVFFRRRQRILFEAHTFPGSRFGLWLRRGLFRQVGGLVVVTHRLKELYTELGVPAGRILVAPDGVDLDAFTVVETRHEARRRLELPPDKRIVGYLGKFETMGMQKGMDTMIRALPLLDKSGLTDVVMCFVGGPMKLVPGYLALAEQENIDPDRLVFRDHVPPGLAPLYLRAFDVCTMPFPWTQHFAYYASPLKLFEYMASETPIVATDLPSTREILRDGENAVLVEPGNPEALAEGIRRVVEARDRGRWLAEKARQDVAAFTWERRAANALNFIGSEMR